MSLFGPRVFVGIQRPCVRTGTYSAGVRFVRNLQGMTAQLVDFVLVYSVHLLKICYEVRRLLGKKLER